MIQWLLCNKKEAPYDRVSVCCMCGVSRGVGQATALERLEIVLGIANGMQYIHAQGMVHMDIKPDNVLLKRDNGVGCHAWAGMRGMCGVWCFDARLFGVWGPVVCDVCGNHCVGRDGHMRRVCRSNWWPL